VLGTDGFGRSDYRRKRCADFFEVDRRWHVVVASRSRPHWPSRRRDPAHERVAEAIAIYGHRRRAAPRRGPSEADTGRMMANAIDIKVPDIGDFSDVPVIELLRESPATR
jgi:hypothetical protein